MGSTLITTAESAAAISAGVHQDRAQYDALYDRVADALSGFPGIWNYIAECAIELERQHPEWDGGDWIETCAEIAHLILQLDTVPPASELITQALEHSLVAA